LILYKEESEIRDLKIRKSRNVESGFGRKVLIFALQEVAKDFPEIKRLSSAGICSTNDRLAEIIKLFINLGFDEVKISVPSYDAAMEGESVIYFAKDLTEKGIQGYLEELKTLRTKRIANEHFKKAAVLVAKYGDTSGIKKLIRDVHQERSKPVLIDGISAEQEGDNISEVGKAAKQQDNPGMNLYCNLVPFNPQLLKQATKHILDMIVKTIKLFYSIFKTGLPEITKSNKQFFQEPLRKINILSTVAGGITVAAFVLLGLGLTDLLYLTWLVGSKLFLFGLAGACLLLKPILPLISIPGLPKPLLLNIEEGRSVISIARFTQKAEKDEHKPHGAEEVIEDKEKLTTEETEEGKVEESKKEQEIDEVISNAGPLSRGEVERPDSDTLANKIVSVNI
jgi:hypothetical protein